MIPRNSKENFPNILKIAEGLKKVGEKHGATAGQVALAWVLAQGDDIIPIVGTTKVEVSCRRVPCILCLTVLSYVESQGEFGSVESEAHLSRHRGGAPSCGGGKRGGWPTVPGVNDAICLRRHASSSEVSK